MDDDCRHLPGQTLRENQPDVAPRAHVPHYGHPAEALEEKVAQGSKIGDGLDGVGEELHFKTLFRDQASYEEIIRRAVFDRGVATESSEMLSCRDNGLAKGELDSVELA